MDGTLYQKIIQDGGWVNLSARTKWQLRGADRVRYLNGQVTQDVRPANSRETSYACITNVKGKVEGDLFIHGSPDGDALILDAEPDSQDTLGLRLEKYIIADDAELIDITEQWHLLHLFGAVATSSLNADQLQHLASIGGYSLLSDRFNLPGIDLWLPASQSWEGISALNTLGSALTDAEAESFRILQQVPRSPHELNADVFPPEAGLENRAMSFTKGCYIGQEILSRIKTTGRMPHQLIAWESLEPGTVVKAGDSVWLEIHESAEPAAAPVRAIGTITSVTQHPLQQTAVGLAYVKQGSVNADSVLLVGNDMPKIEARLKIRPSVNP